MIEFTNQNWNQPVVVGFKSDPKSCFWEPWLSSVNKFHPWTISRYLADEPHIGDDGSMLESSFSGSSTSYFEYNRVSWWAGDGDPNPPAGNNLRFKVTSSLSGQGYADILIQNASGYYVRFFHQYEYEYDQPTGGVYVFCGDNGGDEQIFDLTTYGIMDVDLVRINAAAGVGSVSYSIEYIDFN